MLFYFLAVIHRALCCLAFFFLLCSVFKVQTRILNVPSKLNNTRIKSHVTTFDGIRRRASRAAVIPEGLT